MTKTIKKQDLVNSIAKKYVLTKKTTGELIDDIFELISTELENGNSIKIENFGKFTTKERCEREGINPSTKEIILISAFTCPVFRPAKPLKDRLNKKGSDQE